MADTFPFGQDWATRDSWLGGFNAKSDRWLVSYEGNFSIICGYHSFIFFGLDSMSIGIVNLSGCGPSVGLPVGRILGYADPRNARAIEQTYDAASDVRAVDGALDLESEQAGYNSGMQLFNKMRLAIPQSINAHIPFSLSDLAGSPGGVAGAEVEAVGSASLYWIDAYTGVIGDPYFGPDGIANAGGGLVSATLGGLIGVWSVEKWFNLYYELGSTATQQCLVENSSPAYATPYQQIGANIHPAIRNLPPPYCDLPTDVFDPISSFRQRTY